MRPPVLLTGKNGANYPTVKYEFPQNKISPSASSRKSKEEHKRFHYHSQAFVFKFTFTVDGNHRGNKEKSARN